MTEIQLLLTIKRMAWLMKLKLQLWLDSGTQNVNQGSVSYSLNFTSTLMTSFSDFSLKKAKKSSHTFHFYFTS